jgi:SAM-dependent methyltransferase
VLDVGYGKKPYISVVVGASAYAGLEYDSPRTRAAGTAEYFYGGRQFPVEDGSFDGVLSSQVLQHVFNPDEFLNEVRRVLRPGGTLLLSVPFVWDEHEHPHDYLRYSSFGLRELLVTRGLRVTQHRKTVNDFRAICQLMNAYTFKKTFTGRPYLDLIATLALILNPA